jgi:hypothetical protein
MTSSGASGNEKRPAICLRSELSTTVAVTFTATPPARTLLEGTPGSGKLAAASKRFVCSE